MQPPPSIPLFSILKQFIQQNIILDLLPVRCNSKFLEQQKIVITGIRFPVKSSAVILGKAPVTKCDVAPFICNPCPSKIKIACQTVSFSKYIWQAVIAVGENCFFLRPVSEKPVQKLFRTAKSLRAKCIRLYIVKIYQPLFHLLCRPHQLVIEPAVGRTSGKIHCPQSF